MPFIVSGPRSDPALGGSSSQGPETVGTFHLLVPPMTSPSPSDVTVYVADGMHTLLGPHDECHSNT